MKLGKVAFRNILRNRRRSLLSGTAIAIATMFITLMFSLISGMLLDYESNIVRYMTGHVRIRHVEYDENEELNPLHLSVAGYEEVIRVMEEEPEVKAVVPRTRFATAIYHDDRTYNGLGFGIDIHREAEVMKIQDALQQGRAPQMGEREMLLSAGLAEELGLGVGDKLTLLTKNKYMGMSGMTFAITGIVRFLVPGFNESFFFVPIDTAARFLKMSGEATEVLVVLKDRKAVDEFAGKAGGILAAMGREELSVQPWTKAEMLAGFMEFARTAYDVMAAIFFLLASTVIANTTMMVIFERMREIGTVAAMGMTPREIVRLFFLEAFYIGAIAAFVGVALGVAVTLPLSRVGVDLTASMEGVDMEINPVIYPQLNIRSTVFVFFYATVIAGLASFIPSRRAARIEPVEALRAV